MRKWLKKALVVTIAVFLLAYPIWAFYSLLQTGLGENVPVTADETTEQLTDSLTVDCQTDKEKVHKFYSWIVQNIEYNYSRNGVYQYFSAKTTIETKKGICFDYANLFAVMCRYADIPCYIVDGYRCDDKSKKHTWNRVYYDDTWWNLDTTNDSIRLKQGIALYGFVDIGNDYTMPDKDYVITRYY